MKRLRRKQTEEQENVDALAEMVRLGILEVVTDTGDPLTTTYRMPDPDGVKRALDEIEVLRELGAWP